jgi:hypothetical protein
LLCRNINSFLTGALPQLTIRFPDSHDERSQIAKEFQAKSQAGFSNCFGAIDGVIVWIHSKPSKKDVKATKCGALK